jgi:hypothetical protein
MLTDDEREKIRLEEQYRLEVRKQLEQERVHVPGSAVSHTCFYCLCHC